MNKITPPAALLTAIGLMAAITVGGTFVAVRSAKAQDAQAPQAASTAPTQANGGGLTVFIDPATGQIRQPEAAEIGALNLRAAGPSGRRETPPELRHFELKGGGAGVELDRSFDSAMVVTKSDDGKLKMDCAPSQAAAEAIVKGQATTEGAKQADEK